MQLDLPLWPRDSLKTAIADYRLHNSEGLAQGTLNDYDEREKWLLETFGETLSIGAITYDVLYSTFRRVREWLAETTISRRFDFLRWVLAFAVGRDRLAKVPMFPKLRKAGRTLHTMHTVAEAEVFRRYLLPGPFRKAYDLCFWTLHHLPDVFSMERWMLDGERVMVDDQGKEIARGCFWRRNTKNANPERDRKLCEPCWVPMQPELRLLLPEILDAVPARRDALITGKVWNVQRALRMAHGRAVADGHTMACTSPRDLRRSGASMLSARGWPAEAVRLALGHAGEFRPAAPGQPLKNLAGSATTATLHYLGASPGLFQPRPQST